MFTKIQALCNKLGKPIVVFDLEHTGGKKEERGITEFAHMVFEPGKLQERVASSLVKPGPWVRFNAYVTSITGIDEAMVYGAPNWTQVAKALVVPYADALWVGYNSRSADMPVVLSECQRHGLAFKAPTLQLDLLRISKVRARLSEQVKAAKLRVSTVGAHRAAKDTLMTAHLMEHYLGTLEPARIREEIFQGNLTPHARKKAAKGPFLVHKADARIGLPWTQAESEWVQERLAEGQSMEDIALCIGRRAGSIALAIEKFGLRTEQLELHLQVA